MYLGSDLIEDLKIKIALLSPAIIYILLLLLFPGIFNLYAGFYKWLLGSNPVFVGLENFKRALFEDSRFHHAFQFTTLYTIASVSIELALGLIIALILFFATISYRVNYILRLLMIIPFTVAPITAGYMWRMLFHGAYGPYTYIMSLLGLPRIDIYSDPTLAFWGVVLIDVWQWTPFVFLVLYSGLSSIPREPLEAAMIDGARGFKLIRYIVMPLLKPLILVILLIRVIDSYKVFDTIYIATGGGPGVSTESISLYIYEKGLHGGFELGYSGAIAWLFFVFMLVLATIFIIYFRRSLRL
jgi:multiple sugar transport system permease protein